MKKLFLLGTIALSTFAFSNTKSEVQPEVESSKKTSIKGLTKEQKAILAIWSVSYQNACGTTNTVFFQSDNANGSSGFIRELAYAVNSTYDIC